MDAGFSVQPLGAVRIFRCRAVPPRYRCTRRAPDMLCREQNTGAAHRLPRRRSHRGSRRLCVSIAESTDVPSMRTRERTQARCRGRNARPCGYRNRAGNIARCSPQWRRYPIHGKGAGATASYCRWTVQRRSHPQRRNGKSAPSETVPEGAATAFSISPFCFCPCSAAPFRRCMGFPIV